VEDDDGKVQLEQGGAVRRLAGSDPDGEHENTSERGDGKREAEAHRGDIPTPAASAPEALAEAVGAIDGVDESIVDARAALNVVGLSVAAVDAIVALTREHEAFVAPRPHASVAEAAPPVARVDPVVPGPADEDGAGDVGHEDVVTGAAEQPFSVEDASR
jgi:hypothetical protein